LKKSKRKVKKLWKKGNKIGGLKESKKTVTKETPKTDKKDKEVVVEKIDAKTDK